jgi:hypothetical protein
MDIKMTVGPYQPEKGYGLVVVGDQFKQARSWHDVRRIAAAAGADMDKEVTYHSPSSYPDWPGD